MMQTLRPALAGCLLSLMTILFAAGCDDKKEDSFGVPTTENDINRELIAAFEKVDPLSLSTGEYVYRLRTQEIFSTQQPQESLMEEEAMTVTQIENLAGYVEVTILSELIDHLVHGSPHYEFKDVFEIDGFILDVDGSTSTPLSNALLMKKLSTTQIKAQAFETQVSFFNLIVRDERISKPKKVLEREPCPEGEDCLINVKKISYDIVIYEPSQPPNKISVEEWVSSEVPYLAAVLKTCFKKVVEIEDVRPLVRQCQSVFDYKFN